MEVKSETNSFLAWIDDTNCDNPLIEKPFVVSVDARPSQEIMFTHVPGEMFIWGFDDIKGKTTRILKCINGQSGKTYVITLPAFLDQTTLAGKIIVTEQGHRMLHFFEEGGRDEPIRSHILVEIDDKYRVVSIKSLNVEDGDWEKFNGSNPNNLSDLGIYYSSYLASPAFAGQIPWQNVPVTVLFAATGYPPQPKMYVFHEDNFWGVRKLTLMPLENIIFIKSDKQVLLKAWFGVESRAAGTDQPDSKRPIATATWALDADSISRAFITSGRWLMIDGKRGDKEVFYYYNLTEIFNRAAKKFAPDAQADW
jgi:hypothetical protein